MGWFCRAFHESWSGLRAESEGFQKRYTRVKSGRAKRCSESHGTGRVGTGRARRFSNLTGGVTSRGSDRARAARRPNSTELGKSQTPCSCAVPPLRSHRHSEPVSTKSATRISSHASKTCLNESLKRPHAPQHPLRGLDGTTRRRRTRRRRAAYQGQSGRVQVSASRKRHRRRTWEGGSEVG